MTPEDDFGPDEGDASFDPSTFEPTPEPARIIPFTRMRADPKVEIAWRRELDSPLGKVKGYRFPSPLTALDDLIRQRSLPRLPWPGWPELAKRTVLYAGEVMGISGPSGGGKTSFAIQICRAAVAEGLPVLWLPAELTPGEVDLRIVANIARQHTGRIRDEWDRERIAQALTAVNDHWHFVDKVRDVERQIEACRSAIKMARNVYRRPPVLVVDYLGKLARGAKDPRLVLADAIDTLLQIAVDEEAYVILLSQTSRGNNATLTGKVDLDSASDAIGVSAETGELEHAAAVCIALNVFKVDDADELDSHILVSKARGSGREGREGFRFHKPGGFWEPLPHLPATPNEVSREVHRNTKKGQPVPEPAATRDDLNHKRSAEAGAKRRSNVLGALKRAGIIGLKLVELRKVPGSGSAQTLTQTLTDLERQGDAERLDDGRWRVVPK